MRKTRAYLLLLSASNLNFLGVNPLFDDHLTHASAHTESLWLTRWAREVEGMGPAAARHAAGGGGIELRLVELGHP